MSHLPPAQADVETAWPGWRTWIGADRLCHALRKTGPPLTARGQDWRDLLDEISRAEALLLNAENTPNHPPGKETPIPMTTSSTTGDLTASDDAQRAILNAVLTDAIEWHYDQAIGCPSCHEIGTLCATHECEHGKPIERYLRLARQLEAYEGSAPGVAPSLDEMQLGEFGTALGAAIAYREGRPGLVNTALRAAYEQLVAPAGRRAALR